jgi:hypothetical protein
MLVHMGAVVALISAGMGAAAVGIAGMPYLGM